VSRACGVDQQLVRVLAPGRGVPKVDRSVEHQKRRASLRRRPRCRPLREPDQRRSGDDIGDADVTDEMQVERPGVDNPGHHCVPVRRNFQHGQAVGRQP